MSCSVGYISFQEISYGGKPQVVSSYILSNLWGLQTLRNSKCFFYWISFLMIILTTVDEAKMKQNQKLYNRKINCQFLKVFIMWPVRLNSWERGS
jgi:hypothetical protein